MINLKSDWLKLKIQLFVDKLSHPSKGNVENILKSAITCIYVCLMRVISCCALYVSGDFNVVENAAKERLRNKLSLYNRGLMHTEELLSETGLQ